MVTAGRDPLSLLNTDGNISLSPHTHSETPLLVLSPTAYLNTHVLENKPSINPHTLREFCPEGGGGEEAVGREGQTGSRKKKNEGGNCSVGRNPPSPFPGEEVD